VYGSRHILGTAASIAFVGLALLAAACGASNKGASVSSSSADGSVKAAPSVVTLAHHAQLESEYLRFATCMRSHGVLDFPDPDTGGGGHPGFRLQGGPGTDLSAKDPKFRRGIEACQRILGHQFRFVFTPSGVGKGA
jgi:hypothetical protein